MSFLLPEGFQSGSAVVKDVRMHYMQGGSGDPLVIMHGGWDSWLSWRKVIPELAERYTVILPALRGLASTSKPMGGYDANNLGDDVYRLLRVLGHERFSLVGHDWGALASYTLAAQYREAVDRLCVFEMVLPGVSMFERAMTPQPGGAFLWHMGFHAVPDIPELLIEGHLREYMQWFFSAAAGVPDAVSPELLDHYVDLYGRPGALRAFLQYYREIWTHTEQVREHMRNKLTIPVAAYGGDASLGDLARQGMMELAENVSGGVVPMCGHWIAEEQPDLVLGYIQDFLVGNPVLSGTQ
ncbi:alpha/beta fold hydrolase [Nocardia fusca]|uniref:alpha/beta fold hydrolase n=1 Tax=Nocardia fusca TaxID=941183 RepID=UPI0037C5EF0B